MVGHAGLGKVVGPDALAPLARPHLAPAVGGERKFTGQSLLLNFCLPNFYFHATTAYGILRHCGIEVGKRDFMGTPVAP